MDEQIKTSKLEVDPPGDLKRSKVPVLESIRKYKWRNTSESYRQIRPDKYGFFSY